MNDSVHHYVSTPATAERFDHSEGPCWDPRTDQLLWVDQYVGSVLIAGWRPDLRELVPVRRHELGIPVGAVVPTREVGGGWLTASGHGFVELAEDGAVRRLAQPEAGAPVQMRMNDGKCDDRGRFWAGSMAVDKTDGAGSLYRLDRDLSVTTVLSDVTISNGLAWTAEGTAMYYIDTPTGRVDRFVIGADGEPTGREPAVRIPEGRGFPDGMCIDDEGCLWVALWGASAVHRYSPVGDLLAVVAVDAVQVSSCCFGGPEQRTLFITTSQEGMDEAARAADQHAGRLFCADVDVTGPPAARFGGP